VVLLTIGRDDFVKGFGLFARAWTGSGAAKAGAVWVTVGGAAKAGTGSRIITGPVSLQEVVDWIHAADFGALPSYYEGCSLALLDMLAGGLSGGWCSRPNPEPPLGNDALFMLLDPARLGVLDHFLTEVTNLAAHVRSCPTVEGVGEILLPGDPERRTLAYRSVHGIPLDEGNWGQLTGLARELGVPLLS